MSVSGGRYERGYTGPSNKDILQRGSGMQYQQNRAMQPTGTGYTGPSAGNISGTPQVSPTGAGYTGSNQILSRSGVNQQTNKNPLYGQNLEEYNQAKRLSERDSALAQNLAKRNTVQQIEAGNFDYGSENALAIGGTNQAIADQDRRERSDQLFDQRQSLLDKQKAEQEKLISQAPSQKAQRYLQDLMNQGKDVSSIDLYDDNMDLKSEFADPTEAEIELQAEAERLVTTGQASNLDEATNIVKENMRIQDQMRMKEQEEFLRQQELDADIQNKIANAEAGDYTAFAEFGDKWDTYTDDVKQRLTNAITEQAKSNGFDAKKTQRVDLDDVENNTKKLPPLLTAYNNGNLKRGAPVMIDGKPYIFQEIEYVSKGGYGLGSAYDDVIYIRGVDPSTGEFVDIAKVRVND